MDRKSLGTLIIIGGAEDRSKEKVILREVARRVGRHRLVVTTVASGEPEGLFATYHKAFSQLGVSDVVELPIADRNEARGEDSQRILEKARGVFFTGGDQLRITSQIGDTPTYRRIAALYEEGGVIAGTSAGASVMCETMLVSGSSDESPRVGDTARMAPGLGLVKGLIIDQHFAERGRMSRLLGAVAQNPRSLGVGIDEDTAIIVEAGRRFSVIGSGSVYVIDGADVSASNIAEGESEHSLSIHDIRLHVLCAGDRFDLRERRPGKVPTKGSED